MSLSTRLALAVLIGAIAGVAAALIGHRFGVDAPVVGGVAGALGAGLAALLRPKGS